MPTQHFAKRDVADIDDRVDKTQRYEKITPILCILDVQMDY